LQRSFCMETCGSSSDCRGGYTCEDLAAEENHWRNALPIDRNRSSKVCVASISEPAEASSPPNSGVCTAAGGEGAGTGDQTTGGTSTGGNGGGAGGEGGGDASSSGGTGGSGG
jgi:hypothetical protein